VTPVNPDPDPRGDQADARLRDLERLIELSEPHIRDRAEPLADIVPRMDPGDRAELQGILERLGDLTESPPRPGNARNSSSPWRTPNLNADILAPAEIVGEAKQRRAPGFGRATAALGQIHEKAPVTDVVHSIAQLPSGIQEWTAIAVEDNLGLRAALFFLALSFLFLHPELGPP
jgi:hypothetical protein